MFNPLISVVVPVFNGERYLQKTVDSILSQTYKNIEIILVNDGSTDNSSNVIKTIAKRDSRVKPIHVKNGGVAAARNVGLGFSSGDFIAFCDQDDLWLPDKLAKQIPLFENLDVGLVYAGAKAQYNNFKLTVEPDISKMKRGSVFNALVEENIPTCCTVVIRRSSLSSIGGFDPDISLMGVDDWHLWLKISLVAEFDFVPEPLAVHIFHGDNYSLNDKKMHEAELICLEKIKSLAGEFNKTVDWALIRRKLNIRYAGSYVFSGNFNLAAKTYLQAAQGKNYFKYKMKGSLLRFTPNCILSILQGIKRNRRLSVKS